jgi:hypothetical protein
MFTGDLIGWLSELQRQHVYIKTSIVGLKNLLPVS